MVARVPGTVLVTDGGRTASESAGGVVVLVGGPAAGKSSQARLLSGRLGVPRIGSGDILREHLRKRTRPGRAARSYVERGELVPDDLVSDLVLTRLSQPDAGRGAVLDGFPRTVWQAQTLARRLHFLESRVSAVFLLDLPPDVLVTRLTGLWRIPSMDKPMVQSESVYVDGHSYASLRGRPDDRPDVAKRRVDAYLAQTWPVVSYYEARGLLHRIDGSQSVDRVQQQIVEALRPQPHEVEARAGQ